VLTPLAAQWDTLSSGHKKKWLEIADKYSSMKPDEQLRLQKRMEEWAKLTPQQRRVARESYVRAKKLNPSEKTAHWQQYQQLPEDQKKKLAAEAASKKRVTALTPPSAQSSGKVTPPPKSTLKSTAPLNGQAGQASVPPPAKPAGELARRPSPTPGASTASPAAPPTATSGAPATIR
jgi:hypothetical protein